MDYLSFVNHHPRLIICQGRQPRPNLRYHGRVVAFAPALGLEAGAANGFDYGRGQQQAGGYQETGIVRNTAAYRKLIVHWSSPAVHLGFDTQIILPRRHAWNNDAVVGATL